MVTPLSEIEFTYDALGRRIQSTYGIAIAPLLHYYDSQNVIADYYRWAFPSPRLQRYYIHGSTYIDERIILHDEGNDEDYYYVPRELHSVEALLNSRGHEVERYSYDAYGKPTIALVNTSDVNYDGIVEFFLDYSTVFNKIGLNPCIAGPVYDIDGDGSITQEDADIVWDNFGPALVKSPISAVKNPYAFTGRRLDHIDYVLGVPQHLLYYYRARSYDPHHGRFLQRDPSEYVDGMNLYEYVKSNPAKWSDPRGRQSGSDELYLIQDAAREIEEQYRQQQSTLLYVVVSAIWQQEHMNERYDYYKWTGMEQLFRSLLSPFGSMDITIEVDTNMATSNAVWIAGGTFRKHKLKLSSQSPNPIDVVHEAVHARNTQKGWYQGWGTENLAYDEGLANAIQEMVIDGTTLNLRRMEDRMQSPIGPAAIHKMQQDWQTFWKLLNPVIDHPWQSGGVSGQITRYNVWDVYYKYRFRYSCRDLADSYNKVIKDSCNLPNCKLRCNKESLEVELHPPFK